MADKTLSQVVGGGGTPIRGTIRLTEDTPDDYTINGQRFLRQGVIESDQNTFDTSIWNVKNFIPTDVYKFYSTGIDCFIGKELSNGTLLASNYISNYWSEDGGETWGVDASVNPTNWVETDNGLVVWGANDTQQVRFASISDVSNVTNISVGSGASRCVATDGVRVVVAQETEMWYSTNPALTAWSICSGSTPTNTTGDNYACIAYGNGVWVASSENAYGTYYSTDGITWTQGGNPFSGISVALGISLYFDASEGFIVAIAEVGTSGVFVRTTSVDGVTWTTPEQLVKESLGNGKPQNIQHNVTSGLTTCNFGEGAGFLPHYTTDGINWKLFRLSESNEAACLIPTSTGGIECSGDYVLKCDYALFAGAYTIKKDYNLTIKEKWDYNSSFTRIS